MAQNGSLLWGSSAFLVDPHAEKEEIYEEDIQDGIANLALEQAQAWALEAQETGESGYVAELLRLTKDCVARRSSRNGALGTTSRLQPRFQKGKSDLYDSIVNRRTAAESQAAEKSRVAAQRLQQAAEAENRDRQRMPDGWACKFDHASGHMYYYCQATGESTWTKPLMQERLGDSEERASAAVGLSVGCNAARSRGLDDDEEDEGEDVTVVIDAGSAFVKAGFAGDDAPRTVVPTVVGRPKHAGVMVGMDVKEAFVGDEAQCKRGVLTMRYPVEAGVITDFDAMERIWHSIFYHELRVDPSNASVFLTMPPNTPKCQKEKVVEIMFESFQVPRLQLIEGPVCDLYASGRTTGLVLAIGGGATYAVPVYEGHILPHCVVRSSLCGRLLTDYLMKISTERGYTFTTTAERDIIGDMKERLCATASSADAAMRSGSEVERSYELPDGQLITVSNERFRVAEALFHPHFLGLEEPGIHQLVFTAAMRCDVDVRKDLFGNVVLCGGSSMFEGLGERLRSEVAALAPSSMRVQVIAEPDRKYSTWLGASIGACVLKNAWMDRDEFDEYGPALVHRKVFGGLGDDHGNGSSDGPSAGKSAPAPPSSPPPDEDLVVEEVDVEQIQAQARSCTVAEERPLADTNSLLVRASCLVHQQQEESRLVPGAPFICAVCGGVPTRAAPLEGSLPALVLKVNRGEEVLRTRIEGCDLADFQGTWKAFEELCGGGSRQSEVAVCFDEAGVKVPWNQATHGRAMRSASKAEPACLRLDLGDGPSTSPTCEFCGAELKGCGESAFSAPLPGLCTYVLSPPQQREEAAAGQAGLSMVVFAIDISGSMATATKAGGGAVALPTGERVSSVTRLQCVQTAVHMQMEAIRRTQPDCPIAIVPFSSSVSILSEQRSLTLDTRAVNGSLAELLERGRRFAEQSPLLAEDASALAAKVWKLRPSGATALGPAMAVSVGLCPRGGKVVVCTDGLANQGIGKVNNQGSAAPVPFYAELASSAVERGVLVSVVTMEGEECAMEHLGTTADMTGGEVEIVDPTQLEGRVTSIVARRALATEAVLSLRASGQLSVDGQSTAGQPVQRTLGTVHPDSDVAFTLHLPTLPPPELPLRMQVQLRYTDHCGGEYLTVVTEEAELSSERLLLEEAANADAVAIAAVQRAARLAQEGAYRKARLELISTQRLFQRGMGSQAMQKAYLPFIFQAEKLDQFIREREAQELTGARVAEKRKADRDDEAARAIYQMKSLSISSFRSQV